MVNVGGVRSRMNPRLPLPVWPVAFVCEAMTFLSPSPAVNPIFAENMPLAQVVLAGVLQPEPEKFTARPDWQVPEIVSMF